MKLHEQKQGKEILRHLQRARLVGSCGTHQSGCPHQICLSNMLALFRQAFLTIPCFLNFMVVSCKQTSHSAGKLHQAEKMLQISTGKSALVKTLWEKVQFTPSVRFFNCGRLGIWHCSWGSFRRSLGTSVKDSSDWQSYVNSAKMLANVSL